MPNYRRIWNPGGTYFFTVALADRRSAFRAAHALRPFEVEAIVVLPDHLHAIWTLPPDEADYATRWAHIKAVFSRGTPPGEPRRNSRLRKGERGIWQRRFWARAIVDERDLAAHIDYVHINPLKHGWAVRIRDWPWSSFHRYVRRGVLPIDWADGSRCEHLRHE